MNKAIDITGTVLKTERLVLRPWEPSDLNDFYEYARVDGVGQMAGWLPHESIDKSRQILDMFIAEKKVFALEYKGKVIGSLGIELYNEKKFPEFDELACRELGFVLSKEYWGRGLMPEAVKEAIRWLFEDMKLDALFCAHFSSNSQSARVQEKCGFRYLADSRFTTRYGETVDDVVNVLKKEDWLKLH